MTLNEIKPNVLCLEYRQDRTDKDYGSCLWARFVVELDQYELLINSDCGGACYKWCETPNGESFLELMARINDDYLIHKLYGRPMVFDYEATKERIYDYWGEDEENREKLDAIFDEMEIYGGEPDNASEFMRVFEDNNNNDFCDVWELLQERYPGDAIKLVQVFKDYIQPRIREILRGEK